MRRLYRYACPLLLCLGVLSLRATSAQITPQEILARGPVEADYRIPYGADSEQFGDLRLPEGEGLHPVAVVIHGGCLRSFATLRTLDRFSEALTEAGLATWNIEYRRVDSPGGGWPNTLLDVADGLDHVRALAERHSLDLDRVVLIGHSAGGGLAAWAAARHRIPASSPLYRSDPLPVGGALVLANGAALEPYRPLDEQLCGADVIDLLVGGTPEEVPDNYASASPERMLPLGVRQRLLIGADDAALTQEVAVEYARRAREAGDDVQVMLIPDADHFELVAPWSEVWPVVPEAVLSLVREA